MSGYEYSYEDKRQNVDGYIVDIVLEIKGADKWCNGILSVDLFNQHGKWKYDGKIYVQGVPVEFNSLGYLVKNYYEVSKAIVWLFGQGIAPGVIKGTVNDHIAVVTVIEGDFGYPLMFLPTE